MMLAPITGVFGLIGFSGRSGREAEQLAVLQPLAASYGDDWWFRTVLAFAEIELHEFAYGLRNIETALRGNPRNAHAAHIRAHLYYELGEREDGLRFLTRWAQDYPKDGQLHCHVSWHQAIWSLETGRRAEVGASTRAICSPAGRGDRRSTSSPIARRSWRARRWPAKPSIRRAGAPSANSRRNGSPIRGRSSPTCTAPWRSRWSATATPCAR
jgi:hypothetical protein